MAEKERRIDVVVQAQDKASKEIREISKNATAAAKSIGSGGAGGEVGTEAAKGFSLASLKQNEFLKGTKDIGKLLKGGGALLGLKLIAKEALGFATDFHEAMRGLASGEYKGGEAMVKIAEGLPILGTVLKAVHEIGDAFKEWSGANELKHAREELTKFQGERKDRTEKAETTVRDKRDREHGAGLAAPEKVEFEARQRSGQDEREIDKFKKETDELEKKRAKLVDFKTGQVNRQNQPTFNAMGREIKERQEQLADMEMRKKQGEQRGEEDWRKSMKDTGLDYAKQNIEEARRNEQRGEKAGEMRRQADAVELEAIGQGSRAKREAIKAAAEAEEKDTIARARAERLGKPKEEQEKIRAGAVEQVKAVRAKAAADLNRLDQEQEGDRFGRQKDAIKDQKQLEEDRFEVSKQMAERRLDLMKMEADAGIGKVNKFDVEKSRIDVDIEGKKHAIDKKLEDGNLTGDQQRALRAERAGLNREGAIRKANVTREENPDRLTTFTDNKFDTGVAETAKQEYRQAEQRRFEQEVKTQERLAASNDKLADAIGALVAGLLKPPTSPSALPVAPIGGKF